MKLQNTTVVILGRLPNYGLAVRHIIENPDVPSSNGLPIIGPLMRRLKSVKEVAKETGLSKGKAADLRRQQPIRFLADFPGQQPLETATAA